MKISLIPAGDISTASSRIRVYSLYRELKKRGTKVSIGIQPGSNVIFVQKRIDQDLISKLKNEKRPNNLIIYDVDDSGSALNYWASPELVEDIFKLADFITTDTLSRIDYIKSQNANLKVELIPDCIDYFPSKPLPLNKIGDFRMRVLWFGSFSNIDLFKPYISTLCDIPNLDLVMITNQNSLGEIKADYPNIITIPWNEENFTNDLRSCHLTCLMHDNSGINSMKSNNKMIASIAWGIPAVISRTTEYERTAKKAGIEYCLFNNQKEMAEIIESLRPIEKRKEYLNASQKIIWENYSPERVADIFLSLIAEQLSKK